MIKNDKIQEIHGASYFEFNCDPWLSMRSLIIFADLQYSFHSFLIVFVYVLCLCFVYVLVVDWILIIPRYLEGLPKK